MNIFSLEYAVLLIAFLIVAYNMLKTGDGDNRNGKKSALQWRTSQIRRRLS